MTQIVLPSLDKNTYTTVITIPDKTFVTQKFWYADILCSTPTIDAKLTKIGIAEHRLTAFIQDLKRLPHTGRAKLEIRTRDKEQFMLLLRSVDGGINFFVDVFLAEKSNFVHLKYEIDPDLLRL